MNTNQAGSAPNDEIVAFCDTLTAALDTQIAELEATIAEILRTDPSCVAPHPRESGIGSRRRRIRGGRADLTRALLLAARVAIRHDPYFQRDFNRYMARPGKAYTMGVIAVANKMLTLLSVMVRDGLMWTDTHASKSVQPVPSA